MATPEVTLGSQSEESNVLDLPSACDIRDYMVQRPSQEAHSEALSSVEALSTPSSDGDPGKKQSLKQTNNHYNKHPQHIQVRGGLFSLSPQQVSVECFIVSGRKTSKHSGGRNFKGQPP